MGVRAQGPRFGALAFVAAAVSLCLLAFATLALAGQPNHPPNGVIGGFNEACGTAVDSQGDVYVSSAGESKIRIFDPEHHELTPAIANGEEPCGLAVDTKGNLYVSESKTSKVVKYHPTAYPFAGSPSYEAPVTIDSSGKAKGISVDPADDRLYVAEGDHIAVYKSDGSFEVNVGEGTLEETKGVGAYTYPGGRLYVFAADLHGSAADEVDIFNGTGLGTLKPGTEIDGQAVPDSESCSHCSDGFGFGLAGTAIGVDQVSGHFMVYDAAHSVVDEFEASGEFLDQIANAAFEDTEPTGIAVRPQRNEVQIVSDHCENGTLTLSFKGELSGPIPCQAKATEIQAALEALPVIGKGNVLVAGTYTPAFLSGGYHVAFIGALGNRDMSQLVVDGSGLSGGADFAEISTEAQGLGPGQIYVTAGPGAGAKLLFFGPLSAPSRSPLTELSRELKSARAVATDSVGNVYVAAGSFVHIFRPDGEEVEVGPTGKGFATGKLAIDLAVDATGKVYLLIGSNEPAQSKVQYYTPSSYPPEKSTQYSGPVTVASGSSFEVPRPATAIGLNPSNDHVYAGAEVSGQVIELGAAAEGSPILDHCFACGVAPGNGEIEDVEAYGANGDVYISRHGSGIQITDPTGSEELALITGADSLSGPFGAPPGSMAVDQSNGHAVLFQDRRKSAEEFDASGAFVTQFGEFEEVSIPVYRIAIDNSGGPGAGNAYVAVDSPGGFDLSAFAPLSYGEAPGVVTGGASGLGAGNATLEGRVDPRGFPLKACRFEYLTDAQYKQNLEAEDPAFAGATSLPCAESLVSIGHGTGAVPVHAELSGIDPAARYRYDLVAENEFGPGEGKAGLFGPPLPTAMAALPVLYTEATLRAEVDPSGLATKYRFEYGSGEAYGQSTASIELAPGDGPVAVAAPLTGLAEGAEYHFRVLAENEVGVVAGPDRALVTLERAPPQACENAAYRTVLSAKLPDCRAYELVTPAETRGGTPKALPDGSPGQIFNNWLVSPRGDGAGESVGFFTGTLPGFEGSGGTDGYRAHRARGEGPHPAAGWVNEITSPTFAQIRVGGEARQQGVASDQRYWLFSIGEAALPGGQYLWTPGGVSGSPCNPLPSQDHLELIGCGSLGTDPAAESRYVGPGGDHVIFFSKEHLENEAAPAPTLAIYDRAAGSASAEVVSVKPDGSSFGAGEAASYLASTEDGKAVVFNVGNTLYLHSKGKTTEVATSPGVVFAGLSEDGKRVFYEASGLLFACDIGAGPCVEIASKSRFVNVSADGSHAFFSSEEALTGGEENENGEGAEAGKHNLYAWDGSAGIHFIAVLDPQDFASFDGNVAINLNKWAPSITAGAGIGRNQSPTRSTPGGRVLVFQSHTRLTAYDNEGFSEVYRYDPAAEAGERLTCVSCDPTGAPPSADGQLLLDSGEETVIQYTTQVANLSDDGDSVFFQSPDRLLPEDANGAQDVYEWKAKGAGSPPCKRPGGCLALISSGQGEENSYLYGMSTDGHDVIFETSEKLVGQDIPGSPSLYDARVGGGIPNSTTPAPCQGDSCQGQGASPPPLLSPSSGGSGEGPRPSRHCPRGKHQVRSKGKVRCLSKRHRHQAGHNRRAQR